MEPVRPNKIVVGVDGSVGSIAALRWAVGFADRAGCDVEALMVWEPPARFGWTLSFAAMTWDAHAWAEKRLDETVSATFPDGRPHRLHLTTHEGYPPKILIDRSRDALLLVVGSRGLGAADGFLFGSVSAKCAAHATCPVLIIHEQARDEGTQK